MLPTMIFRPSARARRRDEKRLGEPSGLVELDVDRVVARGKRIERGAVMHELIGADGHRSCRSAARSASLPAGSGCSTSSTPPAAAAARSDSVSCGCQASLASTMSRAWGTASRTAREALSIAVTAKLELEQGMRARLARLGRHRLGRAERQREGRRHGMQRRKPGKLGRAPARPLRLEVPQRTVERVACGARRQQRCELGPGQRRWRWRSRKPRWSRQRPRRFRHSAHRARIRRAPHACRRRSWRPPRPPRAWSRARW